MATARDLTGQRFSKLVAIRPTDERKKGSVVWECQCDCGNIAFVSSENLIGRHTQSCGCLKKEKAGNHNNNDLTGQRFGKLVALRPTDKRGSGSVVWECQCDCGNIAFVPSVSLMSSNTRSCGCLRRKKDRNHYKDLTGQRFGRLVALRPLEERKNQKVIWECQCDCGNIAYVASGSLTSGSTQSCGCLRMEKLRNQHKDLTGQRFGKLVALRPTEERKNGKIMWECKCDCGNIAYVASGNLTNGHTQSCGCLKKEKTRGRNNNDLTGQRFGRLIALRPTEQRKDRKVVWECECDCGNIAYVSRASLVKGHTKSCGCLHKETVGRKYKDLTSQRFGKLIALRPTDKRGSGSVVWECQCDCGNIALVPSGNLVKGRTKSCGCLKKETSGRKNKDLTGQRFGKLVVIRPTDERKNGSVVWECQCDCGNIAFVRSVSLTSGHTMSCGCGKGRKKK